MGSLGAPELIIILIVVIVLFGAKRLPELGGSIGKSIKNFRSGMAEAADEADEADTADTVASKPDSDDA